MADLTPLELDFREEIARILLSSGRTPWDDMPALDAGAKAAFASARAALAPAALDIPFPAGLAPIPSPIDPAPDPGASLPEADVVVVTWTVAENDGLADVFTPRFGREKWYRYNRFFERDYAGLIRNGAPASNNRRLGSYFLTQIGGRKVLCFKSELHLNQDGKANHNGPGYASLPVRLLFKQIIEETKCDHIITTGTCGGIQLDHDLGDVLLTRGARFRCSKEFRNAPFNNVAYKSDWVVPRTHFTKAEELMGLFADKLKDPTFGPPTKRHSEGVWQLDRGWIPNIIHEHGTGRAKILPAHPILTTDYFEFGHSNNAAELWADGCGVEMGDAVLGLVCQEDLPNPPKWLVVRNLSDPQINGDLPRAPRALNMQVHWAVWYYESYGYWTSVMSSLTTWGVIAGL